MGYLGKQERDARLAKVKQVMNANDLDIMFVYFDEFNIGNGWYLTGWCPQFESGAVLIPRNGEPMILGGPESEPFAKLDSAITETRNFPVFMVPNEEYPNATIIDFPKLFAELNSKLDKIKRIGLIGAGRMPADCYIQIKNGFEGVELVDLTEAYIKLRYIKSKWEIEQIRKSFITADHCYEAMKAAIKPDVTEIEVAVAGEYAARSRGASGFGFSAIVGSGKRANAVVPTASLKKLEAGELVMLGLAPKIAGYAGVYGHTVPVSGNLTASQQECLRHLGETFRLTKEQLVVGKRGTEIDKPGREYYKKHNLLKYMVCPFAHTIGLHEAESPFFGPNSTDVLQVGMTVCVDVSFFGHPEWNGCRIETGYEITEKGAVPFSPKMDQLLSSL
ncbi:MAG: hypothetical protein A2Y12_09395 [Planctomycetes bacterium GWF2_42_9]|nr:MAG: hypothetical protein A2Y12_09395 [Planctomycetes bacterium GWF2_42_9]